jgi:hypothetical protein
MKNPKRLAHAARIKHVAGSNQDVRDYLAANPKPAYISSAAPKRSAGQGNNAWRCA